jgi:threonine 3-dehydrogenase
MPARWWAPPGHPAYRPAGGHYVGQVRALVKAETRAGLELQDVPEPQAGPGEVKIRVLRAGLCGTDLHLEQWDDWAASTVRPPMTIGHEFYGEVVEVGGDVDSVVVGQRASGEGHIVCGTCRNCRAGRRHLCIHTKGIGVNRDGAFADYVVIPASNVWVQPDDLDPDLGAVFDPLGNATHTALSFPMAGEDVVITGAGPIGIMAAALARHVGARHVVVTDISDYRLDLAKNAGADLVVNATRSNLSQAMRELGMKEGYDVGLEMSGVPAAFEDMLANMNHGGRVAMLGLPKDPFPIDWGRVITHMITIKGIYGREMYDTWYAMSSMLGNSELLRERIASVITHRFPAERWQDAFAAARSGQCGKVIMDWS